VVRDSRRRRRRALPPDEVGAKRNVVPLSDASRRPGGSVAVFAPRSFGDVTEIADALRARQVVIVNVQGADRNLLQARGRPSPPASPIPSTAASRSWPTPSTSSSRRE